MTFKRIGSAIADSESRLIAQFSIHKEGESRLRFFAFNNPDQRKSDDIWFTALRLRRGSLPATFEDLPAHIEWALFVEIKQGHGYLTPFTTRVEGYSLEQSRDLIKEAMIAEDEGLSVEGCTAYYFYFAPERAPEPFQLDLRQF